jgi:hypothetical protein
VYLYSLKFSSVAADAATIAGGPSFIRDYKTTTTTTTPQMGISTKWSVQVS